MESSVPEDGADIARLLGGYPDGLYLRGRRVNPASTSASTTPAPTESSTSARSS